MTQYEFICNECFQHYEPDSKTLRCRTCRGTLSIKYKNMGDKSASLPYGPELTMPMPLPSISHYISLGEGKTPTVRMQKISDQLGIEIFAKLEFMNPTGSFKDRGTAMMISAIKLMGISEIVEDSSGNAGASLAAYASRAGIKAHIFAPSSTPSPKLNQIKIYDSILHTIDGTRDETTRAAEEFVKENSLVYASHNLSPYFVEGTKTFGYEMFNDLDPFPDNIVVPVGNGSLFLGIWKSITEQKNRGIIKNIPKLHCIQALNVNPIASQTPWDKSRISPTVAGGIAVGSPPRKLEVLKVIKDSGGYSDSVTEESIMKWQIKLAKYEGVFCELTSAAAFAGLENLVRKKEIGKGERVLVPVTGSGLKEAFPTN